MTSWNTIFSLDPPVRGEPSEFATARNRFGAMQDDAEAIKSAFESFTDAGSADNLEGEAGTAFARLLDDVFDGVMDLPRVSGEAETVFSDHHTRLVELRDAADQALERAIAAWNTRNDLQADAAALQQQVDAAASQAESLAEEVEANPEADNADQLDAANTARGQAADSLRSTESAIGEQQAILDDVEGEWHELREAEDSRDDETVDALDGIDLGDLEDPGLFESIGEFVSSVLEAFADFVLDLTILDELINALATGDWGTLLWELKQMLDVALLVLGTIALFTGIGAPLGLVLIGLGVASLAVNTALYVTQLPNPETGETVGLDTVLISAVGVVFSGASVLRTMNAASRNGTTFMRQFAHNSRAGWSQGGIAGLTSNVGRHINWFRSGRVSGTMGDFGRGPQRFGRHESGYFALRDSLGRGGVPVQRDLYYVNQRGVTTLWNTRGVVGGSQNFVPGADLGDGGSITGSTGLSGTGDKLAAFPPNLGTSRPTAGYFRRTAQNARFPEMGRGLAPGHDNVVVIPAH